MSVVKTLPHALSGERESQSFTVGAINYYFSVPEHPESERPLLLIHSINAAAGAHEVRPLFDYFKSKRIVYALDLPGFGLSDRSDKNYTIRLMTDAIHDITQFILERHQIDALDALAVSLSCEYLSRAATETKNAYNSLALVSPTGFNRNNPIIEKEMNSRGNPSFLNILNKKWIGPPLFKLLTTSGSIKFFLRKTWGSKNIDQQMFEYACLSAKMPGAQYAPFHFLSGFLFSRDINWLYQQIDIPVWMSHGNKGDFTDYRWQATLSQRENWTFREYDSGALPYFEHPEVFIGEYETFLAPS